MIALSDRTDSVLNSLIEAARRGDREALGDLLQRHDGYLKLLVSSHLDARLQSRVNAFRRRPKRPFLKHIAIFGQVPR